MSSDCRGTSILVDIEKQRTHFPPVSNNSRIDKINERVVFNIKHLAAENGFLMGGGVGSKQGEFYNCTNSRNSFQHIH